MPPVYAKSDRHTAWKFAAMLTKTACSVLQTCLYHALLTCIFEELRDVYTIIAP